MNLKSHVNHFQWNKEKNTFEIGGYAALEDHSEYTLEVSVNGITSKTAEIKRVNSEAVPNELKSENEKSSLGFIIIVPLLDQQTPELIDVVLYDRRGNAENIMHYTSEAFAEQSSMPLNYCIDDEIVSNGYVWIRGWAVQSGKEEAFISLVDAQGNAVPCNCLIRLGRRDITKLYHSFGSGKQYGFSMIFKLGKRDVYTLHLGDKNGEDISISYKEIAQRKKKRSQYLRTSIHALRYLRRHGIASSYKRLKEKIHPEEKSDIDLSKTKYNLWFYENRATEEELEKQRNTKFERNPKISILVPLYKTPEKFLLDLVQSIQDQTYPNWELCLGDGSGNHDLERVLAESIAKDNRIVYKDLHANMGLAGNTNAALDFATGEYIGLLDHDDLMAPDALFEVVKVLNEHPDIDNIYTDEDKIDMDGVIHFDPNFKSDFNLDLFQMQNYICHFFVTKREIAKKIGGFGSAYDGAQDYDFIMRCYEESNRFYHIPKILYHWRSHINSTAGNPMSKMYAYESGVRVLQDHYQRCGVDAEVKMGYGLGTYQTTYALHSQPLVSVIIPNKDYVIDLRKCVNSLLHCNSYKNIEIIIVENNSTEPGTFEYYEELKQYSNVRVVTCNTDGFDYSKINNFGAKEAKGEYLLLLNNDTEFKDPSAFTELVRNAVRPEIGIVGARLLHDDDNIQHAGVVFGIYTIAGHVFENEPVENAVRPMNTQNFSAVTGACLMIRKSLYDQVGGLSEKFAVAFNDLDLCLKIRKMGYLIAYTPYATLYHYGSKSRGLEDTPEKRARFEKEIHLFQETWPEILKNGDPYYNSNLTLEDTDYSLRKKTKEV